MSQFITHNNKRYEIVDDPMFIGCLILTDWGNVIEMKSLGQIEYATSIGGKMIVEIPIFTEHTLSSIMIKADHIIEDKKERSKKNKKFNREFDRIRLTTKDFLNRTYQLTNIKLL